MGHVQTVMLWVRNTEKKKKKEKRLSQRGKQRKERTQLEWQKTCICRIHKTQAQRDRKKGYIKNKHRETEKERQHICDHYNANGVSQIGR